jgi:hypothetical protein
MTNIDYTDPLEFILWNGEIDIVFSYDVVFINNDWWVIKIQYGDHGVYSDLISDFRTKSAAQRKATKLWKTANEDMRRKKTRKEIEKKYEETLKAVFEKAKAKQ